jgi:hypothetical protein
MLLHGDECRRTQKGNNNTYCQDNELSWFDWSLVETNAGLVRFVRELIRLRSEEPTLRRREFLCGELYGHSQFPDASWYNAAGLPMNWDADRNSLTLLLGGVPALDGVAGTHASSVPALDGCAGTHASSVPAVANGRREFGQFHADAPRFAGIVRTERVDRKAAPPRFLRGGFQCDRVVPDDVIVHRFRKRWPR